MFLANRPLQVGSYLDSERRVRPVSLDDKGHGENRASSKGESTEMLFESGVKGGRNSRDCSSTPEFCA